MEVRKVVGFLIAGTLGYACDAGFFYLLYGAGGWHEYAARAGAFVPATLLTWLTNRRHTFGAPSKNTQGLALEYLAYLRIQTLGIAVNYLAFLLLQTYWAFELKLVPLAVGSIAAMFFNFFWLNRYYAQPRP